MKFRLLLCAALCTSIGLNAQKYFARDGQVRFFSSTPIEDIEAVNSQTSSIVDWEKNQVAFRLPIKGFQFEKALMQEHFNENYLESDQFPSATFAGSIIDIPESTDGLDEQELILSGILSIHGVDQKVEETFRLTRTDQGMDLKGAFVVRPKDYGIEIPSVTRDKIAQSIEVSVNIHYKLR
jgi:polyisoprenoid-binding protein YceI